jgi:hypothetical protein
MSTFPHHGNGPTPWGLVLVALLVIGGIAFLTIGSWRLSDGLNGVVIDHTNPYVHFSETTATQEVTDGIIYLVLGTMCFIAFAVLFFTRRKFLFPPEKQAKR